MVGTQRRWGQVLWLFLLLFATTAASADTTVYTVRGPGGAVAWGLGNQPGTEVVVFAFSDLAPVLGSTPAPGPRVTFSVTQFALLGVTFLRRQWYGDVALNPEMLTIGANLTETTLDAEVVGSLEERSGTVATVQRGVPGRLQVRWTPNSVY
jgi:hypothetical protein